jgi:hypothetical protein
MNFFPGWDETIKRCWKNWQPFSYILGDEKFFPLGLWPRWSGFAGLIPDSSLHCVERGADSAFDCPM